MINITKEKLGKNGIEVIVDSVNALWLNVITNKFDKIYKKSRYELVDEPIKQPNTKLLHIDLALKIIMDCRTDKSCSLKKI